MTTIISGVASIGPYGEKPETIKHHLYTETVALSKTPFEAPRLKATYVAPQVEEYTFDNDIPRSVKNVALDTTYRLIVRALKDANIPLGWLADKEKASRIAIVSAFGATGIESLRNLVTPEARVSPFDLMKSLPTAVTGPLSTHLKFKGRIHTVQHACASGLRTIAQGMDLIDANRADIVICVSVESLLLETLRGFDAMRALYRGEDKDTASIPFGKDRSGFVFGEGGGCVVLERNLHPLTRVHPHYGRCVHYADYSDGEDMTNPSGEGARRCLQEVYSVMRTQKLVPDFVSAHATSTPNGDMVEAKAIRNAIGTRVPVVALKRLIGHTVTASGILEFIYSLYLMEMDRIPSNGTYPRDPVMDLIYLPTEPIDRPIKSFIKNAFGFGGLNCVVGVTRHV